MLRISLWMLVPSSVSLLCAAFCQEEPKKDDKKEVPAKGDENPLMDPGHPKMNETAPAEYKVKFSTSRGEFVLHVKRDAAPKGADRLFNLVKNGFYNECRFFRVVPGFVVQFGINGDPKVSAKWRDAKIKDDPVKESNTKGTITFATSGPDSRTTQVFLNLADNKRLDGMGFSSFGKVIEGMDVVEKLHSGYGEGAPRGQGPDQGKIQGEGNEYLKRDFDKLDYVKTAQIMDK